MFICFAGLIFVVLTLPGALRRRGPIVPTINNVKAKQKEGDYSPVARDRQEVLESWEKCANNPNLPPPIPPAKPHHYFGDERGPDRID